MRAVGLTEGMVRENLCCSRGHTGSTDEDSQVFSFNNLGSREGGSLSRSRNGMVNLQVNRVTQVYICKSHRPSETVP